MSRYMHKWRTTSDTNW